MAVVIDGPEAQSKTRRVDALPTSDTKGQQHEARLLGSTGMRENVVGGILNGYMHNLYY